MAFHQSSQEQQYTVPLHSVPPSGPPSCHPFLLNPAFPLYPHPITSPTPVPSSSLTYRAKSKWMVPGADAFLRKAC